jgi:hypothetical protein
LVIEIHAGDVAQQPAMRPGGWLARWDLFLSAQILRFSQFPPALVAQLGGGAPAESTDLAHGLRVIEGKGVLG